MDPLKDGGVIFKKLSSEFGNRKITQLSDIKKFFSKLIEATKGLLIVDFLDAANWDRIESFDLNDETRILTLVWHDFRKTLESPEEKELWQAVFPASVYSLGIAINSIVPLCGKESCIFLLNGFAMTQKEIKKLYKIKGPNFRLYDNSFFRKTIVRKIGEEWEIIDFHCTPFYSIAILPKNIGLGSFDSKKILYQYNLQVALQRMSAVINSLEDIDASNPDLICEKVNTARRIFEFVLKIECCYRDIKIKEPYSQVRLGSLLSYVKKAQIMPVVEPLTTERSLLSYVMKVQINELKTIFGEMFGEMANLLNEFSHDSGKEINLKKAKFVCMLVMAYSYLLKLEISSS